MKNRSELPKIIQGGMGIGVSNWKLARSVAQCGQLGVVSGTALDAVVSRRLQLGDLGGHVRRALSKFPVPSIAKRILDKFYVEDGKDATAPFKLEAMPSLEMRKSQLELLIASNFVEVFLAKEGHDKPIGINFMEKIQLPLIPSLFGAMLAGIDYVLVGAGIPLSVPGILEGLSKRKPVQMKLDVEDNPEHEEFIQSFDPNEFLEGQEVELERPNFLAIVSSEIVAKSMIRRANGPVDGFIVETNEAGGHNAPPRNRVKPGSDELPSFGPKDVPDIGRIAALEKPFWIAGSQASPEALSSALEQGAQGIQVGSAFAFCDESGIVPELKSEVIRQGLSGELDIVTDFQASPTGYPFKLARISDTIADGKHRESRPRVCDLGYLRQAFNKGASSLGFRCPGEPEDIYEQKGGKKADAAGKVCLCNGLLATIGLGQIRKLSVELPIVTAGQNFEYLRHVMAETAQSYGAKQVIDYILGNVPSANAAPTNA